MKLTKCWYAYSVLSKNRTQEMKEHRFGVPNLIKANDHTAVLTQRTNGRHEHNSNENFPRLVITKYKKLLTNL